MQFDEFLARHPALLPEVRLSDNKSRRFPIALPTLAPGSGFEAAYLVLPQAFPNARARIQLSKDAVLRIPHIEHEGKLCFSGDAGPSSGASPMERIGEMLWRFADEFYNPWRAGMLDGHFEREPRNYWAIHVDNHASERDAITAVYTFDARRETSRIYKANLVQPSRWLLAGTDSALSDRIISSLGLRATQIIRTLVAEIPVDCEFTPATWPNTQPQLETLLALRLAPADWERFSSHSKQHPIHRVVLLSAPSCGYAFLLRGGPATVVVNGNTKRAFPTNRMVPLTVSRIDPSWAYGRDQHPQVAMRQQRHVLVCGAGALGSQIIDQLARAGVGRISIVDAEVIVAANVGRHLLGVESIALAKASGVAREVQRKNPACQLHGYVTTAEAWLQRNTLKDVDFVVDLTGEPDVRFAIEGARQAHPRPLLIGWMEPYVAAAHACQLALGCSWLISSVDTLEQLQAVSWPPDVMQQEPGCGSQFQSYTQAAAAHAVALIAESTLELIDGKVESSRIRSWVRGQRYLDAHYSGLSIRPWAHNATAFDGISLERNWHG